MVTERNAKQGQARCEPTDDTVADLNADTCVCCDEIIPEGRQVCPICEKEAGV